MVDGGAARFPHPPQGREDGDPYDVFCPSRIPAMPEGRREQLTEDVGLIYSSVLILLRGHLIILFGKNQTFTIPHLNA